MVTAEKVCRFGFHLACVSYNKRPAAGKSRFFMSSMRRDRHGGRVHSGCDRSRCELLAPSPSFQILASSAVRWLVNNSRASRQRAGLVCTPSSPTLESQLFLPPKLRSAILIDGLFAGARNWSNDL